MRYYELSICLKLNKSINNNEAYYELNKFINTQILKDNFLKELHKTNTFKHYNYGLLWPIEKDKTYKTNKLYMFNIRSIDIKLVLRLSRVLESTEVISVVSKELKNYSKQFISELSTLTPILVTMKDKKYWTSKYSIKDLLESVTKNAIRKYNHYYNENISETTEFIDGVVQTNKTPIKIPYKTTTLIGNKFVFKIKEDEISQKLAFFIKSVGTGEKNTLGFGYTLSR